MKISLWRETKVLYVCALWAYKVFLVLEILQSHKVGGLHSQKHYSLLTKSSQTT